MDSLIDNFSNTLEEKINQINNLKKEGNAMVTLEKRVDLLSFCMALIERSELEMLNFKESHAYFSIPEVINIDYKLSDYAERFYNQAYKVSDVIAKNMDNPSVRLISISKKETFLNLIKKMMEISGRWHIEKFINVFEYETEKKNRAFPKRKPLLEECIFFADRMNATKLGIKFEDGIMPKKIIFTVQPSGGKSFIANCYSAISLILHRLYYKTSGILRESNNTTNACGFSDQIKAMLENEKITNIYPELKKYFSKDKTTILEKSTSEEWKIAGLDPRIRASHFARGRDSAINSIRIFVALIIDDLSDGFDQMNNDEAHQAMTTKYYIDMLSRAEGGDIPQFILGTMFNEFDIQNQLIKDLEQQGLLIKDENYRDVRRTPDFSTIIITVDCFDENGESYAPKLITTKELRERQQNLKPYEFDLVYRQIRSSREPRVFDYNNLHLYKELPKTLKSYSIAVLDPTRKNGSDFFSLPVFRFDSETNKPYLVDCIYEQKSLGKLADPQNRFFLKVVKFLIENNVKEFTIENNTSNTLGTLFEEKFKEFNYYCKINEFYTAKEKGIKNKLEKILVEEPTITANIYFPSPTTFPPMHRVTLFMTDFTRFDSKRDNVSKKQHDDAPDSVAIFSRRYLYNSQNRLSAIKGINKANLWRK